MSSTLRALVDLLSNKPVLGRKDLARRYNRSLRTIDQWHASGTIPKAYYLPGCAYPFWRPLDIIRAEKKTDSLFRALTTARHEKQLSLFESDEPTQAASTPAKETTATAPAVKAAS